MHLLNVTKKRQAETIRATGPPVHNKIARQSTTASPSRIYANTELSGVKQRQNRMLRTVTANNAVGAHLCACPSRMLMMSGTVGGIDVSVQVPPVCFEI